MLSWLFKHNNNVMDKFIQVHVPNLYCFTTIGVMTLIHVLKLSDRHSLTSHMSFCFAGFDESIEKFSPHDGDMEPGTNLV